MTGARTGDLHLFETVLRPLPTRGDYWRWEICLPVTGDDLSDLDSRHRSLVQRLGAFHSLHVRLVNTNTVLVITMPQGMQRRPLEEQERERNAALQSWLSACEVELNLQEVLGTGSCCACGGSGRIGSHDFDVCKECGGNGRL